VLPSFAYEEGTYILWILPVRGYNMLQLEKTNLYLPGRFLVTLRNVHLFPSYWRTCPDEKCRTFVCNRSKNRPPGNVLHRIFNFFVRTEQIGFIENLPHACCTAADSLMRWWEQSLPQKSLSLFLSRYKIFTLFIRDHGVKKNNINITSEINILLLYNIIFVRLRWRRAHDKSARKGFKARKTRCHFEVSTALTHAHTRKHICLCS